MAKTKAVRNHPGVYSYETRHGKRYAVVVTVKEKQRWQQGFATLAEAEAARERLKNRGSAPVKLTLAEYLTNHWLPSMDVDGNTLRVYRGDVARIIKHIGDVPLVRLEPLDIEALKIGLRRDGLAPRTQHHSFTRLSQALAQARRWRLISYNPCEDVNAPDKGRYEPPIVKDRTEDILERVKKLLAVSEKHGHGFMVYLTVMTGMREKEVFGLEWQHIDFSAGSFVIPRDNTKTDAGERMVLLDEATLERLRLHRLAQVKEFQASPQYVFVNFRGQKWEQKSFWHYWRRIREEAGVPELHFHDLRHINATLLSRAKIDPKVVQARLGHADISTTLGIYTHTNVDMQREAAEALKGLLG